MKTESSVDDWKTVRRTRIGEREKQYYTYMTKVRHPLDGICQDQIMMKNTGVLNFSAKEALYALLDKKFETRWNILMKKLQVVEYDSSGDYDVVHSYNELEFFFFLKRRYCYGVATVVYDSKRKCYMWCCKSSTGVEEQEGIHERKNPVRIVSVGCYTIYEMGDNKCRYSAISSADIDIKQNETVLKVVAKKRGKTMHEEWGKMCQLRRESCNGEKPENHNQNLDTLDSFVKRYGTKSWIEDDK